MEITVNTNLVTGVEPVGDTIAQAAAITTFTGGDTGVTWTLPADPATTGAAVVTNRVVALINAPDYIGNEQDPTEWDGALYAAQQGAGSSNSFAGVTAGEYRLVWQARWQVGGQIITRGDWSVGASVTIGASNPITVPAQMAAPSLAVNVLDITATLAADPADGGSAIISRDLRWSVNQTNWTLFQGVTSPVLISNLAGETLHYVQTRANNVAGNGAWSASATATTGTGTPDPEPEPSPVSDDLTLANISLLATDAATRGVRPGVVFKVPGQNALPTGVSISGDRIVFSNSAQGTIMDGWNLFGYGLLFENGCNVARIRDCVFGIQRETTLGNAVIRVGAAATIDLWEWCSAFGPGYFGNGYDSIQDGGTENINHIPYMRDEFSGDGANCVTGRITHYRRNEHYGWGSDCIKPPGGGLYEFNYFDPGVNMPTGTRVWDAGATYSVNDVALNADFKMFISRTNGNQGNALPAQSATNTHWRGVDPHYDAVNPRRQTGPVRGQIWRACYFNRSLAFGHVTGPGALEGEIRSTSGGDNNGMRAVRNSSGLAATHLFNGIILEYCVFTEKSIRNISWPVAFNTAPATNLVYSIIRNNWIAPRSSGGTISGTSGHVIQNNVTYAAPNGFAAGYGGPPFAPGQEGPGEPDPVDGTVALNELAFDGYVFDRNGSEVTCAVTLSGTGTPAVPVQVRGFNAAGSTSWHTGTVAGNGTWSVTFNVPTAQWGRWYAPQARVGADDTTLVTGSNTFGCGDVLGVVGQSELQRFLVETSNFSGNLTKELEDENVTLITATGDTGTDIVTTRATAGNMGASVNVGALALANAFGNVVSGRKLMLLDLAHQGTSPFQLWNDADTLRRWSTFEAIVNLARASGGDIGGVVMNWYNAPAGTLSQMLGNWSPGMMGVLANGATFTLGTTHTTAPTSSARTRVDHCFWDYTASPNQRGRGLFARGRTKLHLLLPMPFHSSLPTTEMLRFDETRRVSNAERAAILAFAADAKVQTFLGSVGPGTHLCDFEQDGGDTGQDTHQNRLVALGNPQFANLHLPALLRQAGAEVGEPQIIGTEVINATTVDVIVDLPNGGNLTTLAALLSISAPSPDPSHRQAVTGFQISRGGDKRPIHKTGETSYPAAYRGTVTIHDVGTGTAPSRTGRIRIVLTNNIATGDLLTFLDGQANACLTAAQAGRKLFRWFPMETVPAWRNTGALYPFHGIPVRPQTAMAPLTAP